MAQHIASSVAPKLLAFWNTEPDLWFLQAEAPFDTRQSQITNDQTKYNYVLSSLDTDTCKEVAAVIRNPPHENSY